MRVADVRAGQVILISMETNGRADLWHLQVHSMEKRDSKYVLHCVDPDELDSYTLHREMDDYCQLVRDVGETSWRV